VSINGSFYGRLYRQFSRASRTERLSGTDPSDTFRSTFVFFPSLLPFSSSPPLPRSSDRENNAERLLLYYGGSLKVILKPRSGVDKPKEHLFLSRDDVATLSSAIIPTEWGSFFRYGRTDPGRFFNPRVPRLIQ